MGVGKGKSSFAEVSEQIITYNENVLELMSKLNELTTSDKSSVNFKYTDQFGTLSEYQVPSIGYLKSEIKRLNNNINTLYSIDSNGSLIQTANNKFKKIITVDLNTEPNPIDSLSILSNFKSDKNWFFDGLLNPMLSVEMDLSGKVEDDVKEVLARRYIVNFSKDTEGDYTNLGEAALNSFNSEFRNKTNISLEDFNYWHRTTPGVVSGLDPNYDQQKFDLEPNSLLYDGLFSVLKMEEDTINRKLWYHLNTLEYILTGTSNSQQLSTDDQLILNQKKTSTRYKVIEVSTASSNPRVRLERLEGIEPISVGVGTLKIYSPVVTNQKVNISIGYNERNVVFIKAISSNTNIISKKWSPGVGFWTSDLILNSNDDDNGSTLERYYGEKVYDYGEILKDLVAKKIPSSLAGIPNIPIINQEDFKVVQVNSHLTDSSDGDLIKDKYNKQVNLKSEVIQLDESIIAKTTQLKVKRFSSISSKHKFENETVQLQKKKDGKSKLVRSLSSDIISLKRGNVLKVSPKYRIRGFWDMPEGTVVRGGRVQEIIQFKIRYRYKSNDGKEAPVESFKIRKKDGVVVKENASFANWVEVLTDVRKRVKNEKNGEYYWVIEDVANSDTPNINQLDIPIQQGEMVEFQIKSISEVGYPDSIMESDWSDLKTIDFPNDLNNVLGEDDFILKEAEGEELKASIISNLSAKGLDSHLSDSVNVDDKTYFHDSESILSGFKDDNSKSIDLYTYLKSLTDKIKYLEEKIARSKGEMKVSILRNNDEYVIKNATELSFNVECEDYLQEISGNNIPSGRVYSNDIYTIKDFVLKVDNIAQSSPLGLLSDSTYYNSSNFFNSEAPQVFFVNDRDELLYNNSTGNTRTQLNNQFIWNVNYDTIDDNSITKLSENIGNSFTNSNSLTSILSSSKYNIGYGENTIIDFISSNNSILELDKWVDDVIGVASNTKLLTTIHPSIQSLEDVVETNSQRVKTIEPGEENTGLVIPLNIYFKMNSLDPNIGGGNNYEFINLNANRKTVKHIKKLRFSLENEAENRPFNFTVNFTINRSKVSLQKVARNTRLTLSPRTK